MENLTALSDLNIIENLKKLVSSEREVLCEIISYLYEIEMRKLYLGLGYSSLFESREESTPVTKRYTVTLELSEHEYHLLEEVQQISGERLRSRAVLRALKLYRRVRSPHERTKRRAARIQKKQNQTRIAFTVKVEKPSPPRTVTRHIPVEVRDEVTIRDGGQCTFVASDGQRCTERIGLQFDHIRPFSIGGDHLAENLRICCGAHNRFAYQRFMQGGR